jgi:hypothetical protein
VTGAGNLPPPHGMCKKRKEGVAENGISLSRVFYSAGLSAGGHAAPAGLLHENGDRADTAELLYDFGNIVVGDVTYEFSGTGKAEAQYDEYPAGFREHLEQQPGWFVFAFDSFMVNGECRARSAGRRGFRYLRVRLTGDAGVRSVSVRDEAYPAPPMRPLAGADEELNRIYLLCDNTIRRCMQDYFEDGVKRDTYLWVGDCRIEAQAAFLTNGDTRLARRCLYLISCTQREDGAIPACAIRACRPELAERIKDMFSGDYRAIAEGIGSWILNNYVSDYISFLWEYFVSSRDAQALKDLYPFALRAAEFLMERHPPETVKPEESFADEPTPLNYGVALYSVYYAQLYRALKDLGSIAGEISASEPRLPAWQSRVRALLDGLRRGPVMWEPDREGLPGAAYAEAQAMAVVSGYFTPEEGAAAFSQREYPLAPPITAMRCITPQTACSARTAPEKPSA